MNGQSNSQPARLRRREREMQGRSLALPRRNIADQGKTTGKIREEYKEYITIIALPRRRGIIGKQVITPSSRALV
jgi:hypothetical protein